MNHDYAARQASRNAEARREYAKLLPTLDPAVRALLETTDRRTGKRRLDMADAYSTNPSATEAREMPEPSECPDMAEAVDKLEMQLAEMFDLSPAQAAAITIWHQAAVERESRRGQAVMLARTLGTLFRVENLKQEVIALLYATRTAAANGLGSMRKACPLILKPDGKPVTVASLSKRACWWVGFLDLPPGDGMKDDAAVDSYTQSAKKGHATRRSAKLNHALSRLNPAP
jgi:hypothetical protein